jgi:hypothetical protein
MHTGWLSVEEIISIICRGMYYYRCHIITAVCEDTCCHGSKTRLRPAAFGAQIAPRLPRASRSATDQRNRSLHIKEGDSYCCDFVDQFADVNGSWLDELRLNEIRDTCVLDRTWRMIRMIVIRRLII